MVRKSLPCRVRLLFKELDILIDSDNSNASFAPGGWLEDPIKSSTPLLDFKISPRMNIYLESDTQGSFLIDASISYLVGQKYPATISSSSYESSKLSLEIFIYSSAIKSVNQTSIIVDTVNNEILFSLKPFPATLDPYNVTVFGTLSQSNATVFTASTKLYKLPNRADGGSVTRLDNLYGGLSVRKGVEVEWSLIFPFTYYGKQKSPQKDHVITNRNSSSMDSILEFQPFDSGRICCHGL